MLCTCKLGVDTKLFIKVTISLDLKSCHKVLPEAIYGLRFYLIHYAYNILFA